MGFCHFLRPVGQNFEKKSKRRKKRERGGGAGERGGRERERTARIL